MSEPPIVTNNVHCHTSKGDILIEIYRDWSPLGADRFIELVRDGFFEDIAFFRCVKKFLTQFGISEKPKFKHWHRMDIKDDPNLHKGIRKNYLSFAGGGPNTRSTQLFIAFEDLDFLGHEPWETPFGKVIEGQTTLDALYKGYGDIPPFGKGPDQQKIHNRGNQYLRDEFPFVDYIYSCNVVGDQVPVKATEPPVPVPTLPQILKPGPEKVVEHTLAPVKIADSGNGNTVGNMAFIKSSELSVKSVTISPSQTNLRAIDSGVESRNEMVATGAGAVLVLIVLLSILYYFHKKRKSSNSTKSS